MSAGSLTRLVLWRHDALLSALPDARTDNLVRRSAELQYNLNMCTAQEPAAEAENSSLWQVQGQSLKLGNQIPFVLRSRGLWALNAPGALVFAALSDEQKCSLCGAWESTTAPTRVFAPVCPSLPPSAPQQKRRLEDLEELCFALRGRIDDLEEATGSVIGPAFSRSHAKRISTLERRVFGYSPP